MLLPFLLSPLTSNHLLILLISLPLAHSWTTTISIYNYGASGSPIAYCTSTPPGFCCRNLLNRWAQGRQGSFASLPPGAIAAFWRPSHEPYDPGYDPMAGCGGRVLQSHYGAPSWTYGVPFMNPSVIAGASYIQCPAATAPRAGGSGWVGVLAGLCFGGKGMVSRRDVGTDAKGADAKEAWGYPDVISWNGTNYTDERRGDLVYRDTGDNMLDLGQWN